MMADDNARETELVEKIEVETQLEGKSVTARKKSLGGLDSAVVLSGPRQRKKAELFQVEVKEKSEFVIKSVSCFLERRQQLESDGQRNFAHLCVTLR